MSTDSTIGSNLTIGTLGTTNPASGVISIPGLASGLNSAAIISEIISIDSQPMIELELQQVGIAERSSQLGTLQTGLQTVLNDAQNLFGPGLFDTSESVTSTDPTLITATAASGAAIGGYQVNVTALAAAASRTFTYTSPSSSDTMTIDGQQLTVAAGTTLQSFVNQINATSSLDVQAAVTGTNTVVLSQKTTGKQTGSYIQVSDPGAALSEIGADAYVGQNAAFTVNGTAGSSTSNTVTNAIPGVTLTLGGVTDSSSGSVSVVVSPPSANTQTIETAINQFVSDYNSAVNAVQAQLTQVPVNPPQNTADAEQGTLYNDQDLSGLLTNMRQLMYTSGSGLPTGMAALSDIGISTGAPTGAAAPTSSSLAGDLTVDTGKLTSAIESNPSGVEAVLSAFAQSFQALVDPEAGPGGVISQRISDNNNQTSEMSSQVADMQNAINQQQIQLQQEYSKLEQSVSQSNSQQTALQYEIAQLEGNTSTG